MRIMIAYFGKLAGVSAGLEHICCEMANEMIERGHAVCVVNYEVSRGSHLL